MKNFLKRYLPGFVIMVFMLSLLIMPVLSFAQEGQGGKLGNSADGQGGNLSNTTTTTIVNPIGSSDLITLIRTVLEGIIKIGMPIIVLAVIYSGFLFVAAQGNSEKLNDAKRSLLYTLIGAAILFGAWALAQLVTDTVKAL